MHAASDLNLRCLPMSHKKDAMQVAQWLSGRVLDSRLRGRGFQPHRRHRVVSLSKNINPSLELVQPITERLLMGRKESNQTKTCTCIAYVYMRLS